MGKSRQDSGDSARNTDFARSKTTRIRVRFLKPSHDPSIPPHMAGRGGVFFLALCRVSRGRWRPRRAMKTAAWVGLGCGANWREPCLRRRHQRHGQRGPGQRRRSLLGILQTPRTIPPPSPWAETKNACARRLLLSVAPRATGGRRASIHHPATTPNPPPQGSDVSARWMRPVDARLSGRSKWASLSVRAHGALEGRDGGLRRFGGVWGDSHVYGRGPQASAARARRVVG